MMLWLLLLVDKHLIVLNRLNRLIIWCVHLSWWRGQLCLLFDLTGLVKDLVERPEDLIMNELFVYLVRLRCDRLRVCYLTGLVAFVLTISRHYKIAACGPLLRIFWLMLLQNLVSCCLRRLWRMLHILMLLVES